MSDETLLEDDIEQAVEQFGLFDPFDKTRLRNASYDIAAGRTIVIVSSEAEEGIKPIDLQVKGKWAIPPGRTAILYSQEKLNMPLSMKGRLSLRARQAAKLLFFAGGPIDPGYRGYLFLPIANLSDVPIEIAYGEPIVTAEFVRLSREAEPYSDKIFDSIPPERLPAVPPAPVHTLATLTSLVEDHKEKLAHLRRVQEAQQPALAATTRIVDFVILGALAGIGAGVAAGGIVAAFTQVPDPWNVGAGFGAMGLAAGTVFWLRNRIPHLFAAHETSH